MFHTYMTFSETLVMFKCFYLWIIGVCITGNKAGLPSTKFGP